MSDMRKVKINNRLYDVVDLKDYIDHKENYTSSYTAIHDKDLGLVLPIRTRYDDQPGVYVTDIAGYFNVPEEEESKEYSDNNIIDFSNVENIKQCIEKSNAVRDLEREILTSPDNIFRPRVTDDDFPEMKALKAAVIDKNIDLDKYEPRFGSNYNNDKRLFTKTNISLPMMKRVCNALDIKATLVLENKDDQVPNPMSEPISVVLTESED